MRKFYIICLFLFILAGFYLYRNQQTQLVFNDVSCSLNNMYDNQTLNLIENKLSDEEIQKLCTIPKIDYLNLFIEQKYYLHKNLDRYLNFYATNLDISIDKIISLVNTNQDKEEYQNYENTNINDNYLMLINKHNMLNQDYVPDNLVTLDTLYANEDKQVTKKVQEAFISMYNDALKDNIKLYVTSAYRSFEYQALLYNNYLTTYGEDYTNQASAHPGFSEHQSGLAIDILSPNISMSDFENSTAFKWLEQNSYKYGFILRYPKDKEDITGFKFEAWHYRYVGIEIATIIYNENITFDEYYAFYIDV